MDTRKRIRQWSIWLAIDAGILFAIYTVIRHTVHVSGSYVVEARFEQMPSDDSAFTDWLRSQPGVVPHTVSVGRFEEGDKLLYVSFIQSRSVAGEPPFPDLEGAARRLGYMEPDGPFRDSEDCNRGIVMRE